MRKIIKMNFTVIQNRNRITDVESKHVYQGSRERGITWKIGINIHTLLYIKYITIRNPFYNTRNSTQYSVMTYTEIRSKQE